MWGFIATAWLFRWNETYFTDWFMEKYATNELLYILILNMLDS
jgi:hypothetical protein